MEETSIFPVTQEQITAIQKQIHSLYKECEALMEQYVKDNAMFKVDQVVIIKGHKGFNKAAVRRIGYKSWGIEYILSPVYKQGDNLFCPRQTVCKLEHELEEFKGDI